MRNLINFILKNTHWILFLLLACVSVYFIVYNNEFQRSKYLSVIQDVTGRVYSVSNHLQSYLNLRKANVDLLLRVAELETRVQNYEKQVLEMHDTTGIRSFELDSVHSIAYRFIPAWVVNNSISGIENYITVNKGSKDGISSDMGVLAPNGIVVGVVMKVTPNFSLVIPILNPKFRLSCKVKHNNYFGPLVWDGKDSQYAFLEELPRHVTYNIGDTIVTSGFSTVFPEGILVGTIVSSQKQKNDNFNSLQIKLFTDFSTLNEVLIVQNSYKEEQLQLEKEVENYGSK